MGRVDALPMWGFRRHFLAQLLPHHKHDAQNQSLIVMSLNFCDGKIPNRRLPSGAETRFTTNPYNSRVRRIALGLVASRSCDAAGSPFLDAFYTK